MNNTSSDIVLPVSKQQRINVLDALRGMSILGIALVNVLFFAFPIAKLSEWQWSEVSRIEGISRSAVGFLVEGQFLPVFSMLFGMGLALQMQRSESGFGKRYVRRLLILLAFGIAHGTLIWYGDILALYALLGFIIFWFRKCSPRTLLVTGLILFMVPPLIQIISAVQDPYAITKPMTETIEGVRKDITTSIRKQVAAAAGTQRPDQTAQFEQVKKKTDQWIERLNFLADDQRVYQSGSAKQMIFLRSVYFFVFCPFVAITHMAWRAMGMMLLGMYLYRRGWFRTQDHPPAHYHRLILLGLIPGIVLQTIAIILHIKVPVTEWSNSVQTTCMYIGSASMGLSYMGILYLLYRQPKWQKRLSPLVAVGQMSLSCYLLTSVLFGLIFYGYGLGLIGRFGTFSAELIAIIVIVVITTFSVVWMNFFQYGPMEWVWRVLTYMKLIPMRRCEKNSEPIPVTTLAK